MKTNYKDKNSVHIPITDSRFDSQSFENIHNEIDNFGLRLQQYLTEYRQAQYSEDQANDGLDSLDKDIKIALQALQEKRYEVAVVAPMKAGKSTFLNAIIGADVLASESAACTICRTDVKHIKPHEPAQLLEYRDDGSSQVIAQGNPHEIQKRFLEHTRQIRNQMAQDQEMELPTRFELRHPIESIDGLSSLAGFTLIDTPGPNEWSSGELTSAKVALKRSALEALRSCNAVLFILNYRSFKDNAVTELFEAIVQGRDELIRASNSRIYFILNQVDLRSESDPSLDETVESLKSELVNFGFQCPQVYPTSALQGLLAKLIDRKIASENHIRDFKKFFSARYSKENEEGDLITPRPEKIANEAIKDSGILAVQEEIFTTVIQESGWNLLSDALSRLDKVATSIEDSINTRIAGWTMALDELRAKVDDYKCRSEEAQKKLKNVESLIQGQERLLVSAFRQGVDQFRDNTILNIEAEIEQIVGNRRIVHRPTSDTTHDNEDTEDGINPISFFGHIANIVIDSIPLGRLAKTIIKSGSELALRTFSSSNESLSSIVQSQGLIDNYGSRSSGDPYVFRFSDRSKADKLVDCINQFCSPHIQNYWTDVQDGLIREGNDIREQLVQKIQSEIQNISDGLSTVLGESLSIRLHPSPIQFPSFQFEGLDNQIRKLEEEYSRVEKVQRTKRKKCGGAKSYYEYVPKTDTRSVYYVNLRDVIRAMEHGIRKQATSSKILLSDLIKQQIEADFRNAETQLNQYIGRFETQLSNLLRERVQQKSEAPNIIIWLEAEKSRLTMLLDDVETLRSNSNLRR